MEKRLALIVAVLALAAGFHQPLAVQSPNPNVVRYL